MDDRKTGTNAEDSAPGVGDGPRRAGPAAHRPSPGRRRVWIGVGAVLALLAVIFIARPMDREEAAGPAEASADINPAAPG